MLTMMQGAKGILCSTLKINTVKGTTKPAKCHPSEARNGRATFPRGQEENIFVSRCQSNHQRQVLESNNGPDSQKEAEGLIALS